MQPDNAQGESKSGERMLFVFAFTIIPPIVYTLLVIYLTGIESRFITAYYLMASSSGLAFIGAVIGTFGMENTERVSIAIGSGIMIGSTITLTLASTDNLEFGVLEIIAFPTIFTSLGAMISPRY